MESSQQAPGPLLGAADIRFTKIPGADRYQSMIYIGGRHYGYVFQRPEDGVYVANTAGNEFIGEADTLGALRLVVEKYALGI